MSALQQEISAALAELVNPLGEKLDRLEALITKETDDDLLTVAEVAELMKRTPKTVYTYINSGTLKATYVGKTARVRRRDLKSYLG